MTIDNGISFEEEMELFVKVGVLENKVTSVESCLKDLNYDVRRNSEQVKGLSQSFEAHKEHTEAMRLALEKKLDLYFENAEDSKKHYDKRFTQIIVVLILSMTGTTAGVPALLKMIGLG